MNTLLILPIVIPFLTAIVCLLAWQRPRMQRLFSLAGSAALFGAALALLTSVWQNGIQATPVGNWPAPYGIVIVADLFSALMVVLAGLMGLLTVLYSWASLDRPREAFGYYPLLNIMLMGVCGAFLTGDFFNLYVWFEVLLIASFVLLALGGERRQLEGAVKYVTLNLVSSALFLTALGILYGLTGSLNMADLARRLPTIAQPGLVTTLSILFMIAFGVKAAIFPLFFWLPASYHTPPVVITTIFSALLTKVGVYALIRSFTLVFTQNPDYTHTLILTLAALTMISGVLGAVVQNEFRRLLSFHIISQIGYLLLGLGLFTPLALTGAIFFMAHVILAKSALFLVSGVAQRLAGTYDLKKLGGLYQTQPGIAVLFLIPALSLAGIPPLSGFWAKFILVQAGLEAEHYLLVAVALGVSVLTLYSMTKIWAEAFWKERPPVTDGKVLAPAGIQAQKWLFLAPIAVLVLLSVVMGLAAEPFFLLARQAAEQLLHPAAYIDTVLGGVP